MPGVHSAGEVPGCGAGRFAARVPELRGRNLGSGGLDELPELWIILENLVFTGGQPAPEQEVLEGIPAHDAMNDDAQFVPLEIDPVISQTKPVQDATISFQSTVLFEVRLDDFLRQSPEFAQDVELQFLRHFREFAGAERIKDDLKRLHE